MLYINVFMRNWPSRHANAISSFKKNNSMDFHFDCPFSVTDGGSETIKKAARFIYTSLIDVLQNSTSTDFELELRVFCDFNIGNSGGACTLDILSDYLKKPEEYLTTKEISVLEYLKDAERVLLQPVFGVNYNKAVRDTTIYPIPIKLILEGSDISKEILWDYSFGPDASLLSFLSARRRVSSCNTNSSNSFNSHSFASQSPLSKPLNGRGISEPYNLHHQSSSSSKGSSFLFSPKSIGQSRIESQCSTSTSSTACAIEPIPEINLLPSPEPLVRVVEANLVFPPTFTDSFDISKKTTTVKLHNSPEKADNKPVVKHTPSFSETYSGTLFKETLPDQNLEFATDQIDIKPEKTIRQSSL